VLLSVPGAATIQIVLKELWLPSGTAAQGAATTSSDADGTAARG
jgi:hypothetical protein